MPLDTPAIVENPDLGITESVQEDYPVVDNRTDNRGYPYLEPRQNLPEDDANRINHSLQRVDADLDAVYMASLLDIPAYLLL